MSIVKLEPGVKVIVKAKDGNWYEGAVWSYVLDEDYGIYEIDSPAGKIIQVEICIPWDHIKSSNSDGNQENRFNQM